MAMDFAKYSPSEAQETLAAVARLYQQTGGGRKAFSTSGVRRALAPVALGLRALEMDAVVTRWKHQGYRQEINSEDDHAERLEIGL